MGKTFYQGDKEVLRYWSRRPTWSSGHCGKYTYIGLRRGPGAQGKEALGEGQPGKLENTKIALHVLKYHFTQIYNQEME